jgi:DNA-binding NarL/FixJ family response regulator
MLTKREEEVVMLLKEGRTNQSIAEELHISKNTLKKHLQHIYQKHSVQNRIQMKLVSANYNLRQRKATFKK